MLYAIYVFNFYAYRAFAIIENKFNSIFKLDLNYYSP